MLAAAQEAGRIMLALNRAASITSGRRSGCDARTLKLPEVQHILAAK